MEKQEQERRPRRLIRGIIFILAVIALAALLAEDLFRDPSDPPAARLLPDLPAYRQVEGQSITGYIGALSEGAALLAGQPHLALTIGVVDGVVDCYQEIGGVRARIYSHGERPLEAGLVAVVDEERLNDPDALFRCVTPSVLSLDNGEELVIEPCAASYMLINEDGSFHIIYAASSFSVCRDFCMALEGCTIHRA